MSPWEDPKSEREFQFLDMGAVTEDKVFYHVAITIRCDAISNFSIGRKATILVYQKLQMIPGKYTVQECTEKIKGGCTSPHTRINSRLSCSGKYCRVKKKQKDDGNLEKEGLLYAPGSF
jgi:hypothetical protein